MDDKTKQFIEKMLTRKTVQQVLDELNPHLAEPLTFEQVDGLRRGLVAKGVASARIDRRAPIEPLCAADFIPKAEARAASGYMLDLIGRVIAGVATRDKITFDMAAFKLNYSPAVVERALGIGLPPPPLDKDLFSGSKQVDAVLAMEARVT